MRIEEIGGWWPYADVDVCEDQTGMHFAVHRLDSECRHQVAVLHEPAGLNLWSSASFKSLNGLVA